MKKVAIIGAGASGLMAAEILSQFSVQIEVYEHMPTAGRKILWAGKTGLNLSHSEPIDVFVSRYTPQSWIEPFVRRYDTYWLVNWLKSLGVQTYVGSSGRIFPVEMKGSKFLRLWLESLTKKQVQFFYRHRCVAIDNNILTFECCDKDGGNRQIHQRSFDAIILACGGGSYRKLGSDGAWQKWFDTEQITPLYASNVGVVRTWSSYMTPYFGHALKRVAVLIGGNPIQADVIISHYGLEGGVIYRANRQLYQQYQAQLPMVLVMDLLPDKSSHLVTKALANKKYSLNTQLRKLGLDDVKIALLRECTLKSQWQDRRLMANYVKELPIVLQGFRPMDEAISTGGGVKRSSLTPDLQLLSNQHAFCCGEMLDFEAPTGGYLLTACFATGASVADGVAKYLHLSKISVR